MKMNLMINRIRIIIRNNLFFLPNIVKGDFSVKKYVFATWLKKNFLIFKPISIKLQELVLERRVKNIKTSSNLSHNSRAIEDGLSNLEVVYINLEHRNDRNNEIQAEFFKIGIKNFKRFNAYKKTNGALGCALSHRGVLQEWVPKNSELLMVCEDDLKFIGKPDELIELITLFANIKDLDILCLSYNHQNEYAIDDFFLLSSDIQTMSCYIVKPHMRQLLINNFSQSIKMLEAGVDSQYNVAVDQVWKVLQKKYNFAILKKRFSYQGKSYSDIEKKIVNYKL